MDRTLIGKALKGIREDKGLSVKDVAEKTNLTTATIWNIETGRSMSLNSLDDYSRSLGYRISISLEKDPEL